MPRFQDWPTRLLTLINERRATPFAWGSHDCCMFACDAVLAMTGTDPAKPFRGYSTKAEAAALIAEYGSLESLVAARCADLGFSELATPRKAQRGDLVLFDNAGKPAVGVCIGGEAAFPGKGWMVFHPLRDCRRAWRVT